MTPWAVRLIDELERSDQRAIELARGLNTAQMNWRPAEHRWSVGQCLHHLYVANEVYLPPIAKALGRGSPAPVQEISPGWFGRWFIRRYIEPSPQSARAPAPKKIAPAQDLDVSVLDQFLQSNAVARDLVRRASAYDVNHLRFQNPFIPLIRFTVGTGFEIVSKHERRHLLQAEGVVNTPEFPQQ